MNLHQVALNNARSLFLAASGDDRLSRIIKEKMKNPRPGDLVFEYTTLLPKSLGYLITTHKEFIPYKNEPGGYERTYWYVLGLSGEFMQWHNSKFMRLLEKLHWEYVKEDPSRIEWAKSIEKHYFDGPVVKINPYPEVGPRIWVNEPIVILGEPYFDRSDDSPGT